MIPIFNIIFNNDFPFLEKFEIEYSNLFKEVFKDNNDILAPYRSQMIKILYSIINVDSDESDAIVDFMSSWFLNNISSLVYSNNKKHFCIEDIIKSCWRESKNQDYQKSSNQVKGLIREIEFMNNYIEKKRKPEKIKKSKPNIENVNLLTIHSETAGVGKTTFTIILARELLKNIQKNEKICIIDLSSYSPDLASYFALRGGIEQKGEINYINDYFVKKDKDLKKYYRKVFFPDINNNDLTLISISPHEDDLLSFYEEYNRDIGSLITKFGTNLQLLISDLGEEFDYILIDNQAGNYGITNDSFSLSLESPRGYPIFIHGSAYTDILYCAAWGGMINKYETAYEGKFPNFYAGSPYYKNLKFMEGRFSFVMNKIDEKIHLMLQKNPDVFLNNIQKYMQSYQQSKDDLELSIKFLKMFFDNNYKNHFLAVKEHKNLRNIFNIRDKNKNIVIPSEAKKHIAHIIEKMIK